MKSINPATGQVIKEYEVMDDETLLSIAEKLNKGQNFWGGKTFADRAEILQNAADLLNQKKEDLARLMAQEMGKPLPQGRSEAKKCAWVCEYYAENAANFLEDKPVTTDATESFVCFRPVGTILAIMPWNFPFWQLFRFAAPGLMAGNAALLKHAPNVSGCALQIESLLHEAGVPQNVFRTILADTDQVKPLIAHDTVQGVTLTGSVRAGKSVAEQSGRALKKTVLELGGSDPSIILKDADVALSAETCVKSRLNNSGQSCIAAKRFVVVEEIYDAFLREVSQLMKASDWGNPLKNDDIDIGPMARTDLRDMLHKQVKQSIETGAECLLGGKIPNGSGAFYPPTILTGVKPGMPAYDEELFGPVASFIKVKNEDEAIRVANDTEFGLGASVYTRDKNHGRELAANKLKAGCCFVNELVKSDPRLPFGGIKQSGIGRELSAFGIREFVNKKTVYVK